MANVSLVVASVVNALFYSLAFSADCTGLAVSSCAITAPTTYLANSNPINSQIANGVVNGLNVSYSYTCRVASGGYTVVGISSESSFSGGDFLTNVNNLVFRAAPTLVGKLGGIDNRINLHVVYDDGTQCVSGSYTNKVFDVVKVGPLTAQAPIGLTLKYTSSLLTNRYNTSNGGGSVAITPFPQPVSISLIAPTCNVVDNALQANFGSMEKRKFTGLGVMPYAMTKRVDLNCSSAAMTINYKLEASSYIDQQGGVAGLSADSTAAGIGYRVTDLRRNNALVAFGTVYTLNKPVNELTSYLEYLITAKQTAAQVKPGSANALLTFTLNYQ
ncbi:fimbrial protein [Pseudomonas vancouverensis]|uniref:fimbrial protein n=1 Tax=Pseudomonas vancouverensis TaxID=95300 RepID=UPI0012FDEB47|nr:fimbrial protein [Pseudomonas vancouverensis]